MRLSKNFTKRHLHLLEKMQTEELRSHELPLDLDDVMVLGGNRLIDFDQRRGFVLTKLGKSLLETN